MKVKRLPAEKFPIRLELVIENEDELRDLWHRANIGHGTLCRVAGNKKSVPLPREEPWELFTALETIIENEEE